MIDPEDAKVVRRIFALCRDGKGIRRICQVLNAEELALDAGPALQAGAAQIQREARRLLDDWRGLLGRHVATSRQLLRKLLDRERFVFYPQRKGRERWCDIGVTPTLDKFLGGIPTLKKAGASPTGHSDLYSLELAGNTRRAA